MSDSPESNALTALKTACSRIAPSWPLDQLIAVNPWWHWRDTPFADASAHLAMLGHVKCLMPNDYCKALYRNPVEDHHLQQAINEAGMTISAADFAQRGEEASPRHWLNISDLVDAYRPVDAMSWHEEIIHQLSQFCGDLLQQGHTDELTADRFYQAWLDVTRADKGVSILMNEPRLTDAFAQLPNRVEDLIEHAMSNMAHCSGHIGDYGLALLMDINGWSANLAWLDWQAQLKGDRNDTLLGLLAARLAWDWVLWDLNQDAPWKQQWQHQWQSLPTLLVSHQRQQQAMLIWQRASEIAVQSRLTRQLAAPWPKPRSGRPLVQAAFCIDVRSEVIRRALEAQHPGIQTIGFAGFFGLPIGYMPAGSQSPRPQLPGLLSPALQVTETGTDSRSKRAHQRHQWHQFSSGAPTTFTAVESGGLAYLFKLLAKTLFPGQPHHPVNQTAPGASFEISQDKEPLSTNQKAELATRVLGSMGIAHNLAPRVLLVGHGSSSCNNPHAAGLDCGACGGQTGEINVRVLAQLLNDEQVREAMKKQGVVIPDDTRFVPALHDTTTDEIRCFTQNSGDLDGPLYDWLAMASEQARQERAPALALTNRHRVAEDVVQRSRDWSQIRPEWGLAGNHSFIVAPRARTGHLNLKGSSFLHDYDWQQDFDFSLLELIMTAPMIVTNWINMQYNASVTDPDKFGSGNKVLHNVVGGHLGVFEGNGGDLRIGLPLQSVHDGQRWMHQPRRLSVFIAAPEAAISQVYWQHESVRQLIDNEWLFLFRLGDYPGEASQLRKGEWLTLEQAASAARAA